jgi:hypothetical protein
MPNHTLRSVETVVQACDVPLVPLTFFSHHKYTPLLTEVEASKAVPPRGGAHFPEQSSLLTARARRLRLCRRLALRKVDFTEFRES